MCSGIRENCGDRQGNEEMVQGGNGAKTDAKWCMAASAEASRLRQPWAPRLRGRDGIQLSRGLARGKPSNAVNRDVHPCLNSSVSMNQHRELRRVITSG